MASLAFLVIHITHNGETFTAISDNGENNARRSTSNLSRNSN